MNWNKKIGLTINTRNSTSEIRKRKIWKSGLYNSLKNDTGVSERKIFHEIQLFRTIKQFSIFFPNFMACHTHSINTH